MKAIVPCTLAAFVLYQVSVISAADWPRFRGPNGSAVSDEKGLPTAWSDSENLAWKYEMPGPGSSSPIVSGDRVFVTCYTGYGAETAGRPSGSPQDVVRHLICLNLQDGSLIWQKKVNAAVAEDPYRGTLREHGYASSTPAADGKHVFVFFGKTGVVAFDFDGNQLWQKSVGTNSSPMGFGTGTSLVLNKNFVIVNANAEDDAIVGLDKETGKEVWRAEAKGYAGSWSTPVLVDVGDKQELVVRMPDEVWGIDPNDGGLLWYCAGMRGGAAASVVAQDGIIYTIGGGPSGAGATAIRAGGRDDVSKTHVLWNQSVGSYVPSPVVFGDYMYWVDDRGMAYCLKTSSGEQVYRERVEGAGGVYASAIAADDKLYAVTRRDGTFVLAQGPQLKILAQNVFDSDPSDFNACPAISDGHILLRSNRCVYCVGPK